MVVLICRLENFCRFYKKVIFIFIIIFYKMDNFCCFFFLKIIVYIGEKK